MPHNTINNNNSNNNNNNTAINYKSIVIYTP